METSVHQSKRIKVEHSYACLEALKLEPITIKQEDPLALSEESDGVHNIKIEVIDDVDNLVKTEPTETVAVGGENTEYDFKYVNVPNESEQEIPLENTVTNQSICSGTESVNIDNSSVSTVASEDPLLLVKKQIPVPDKNKKSRPKRKRKAKNSNTDTCEEATIPLNSYMRLGKEKENLQKQIMALRADLKSAVGREKALQTELGARRMSEIFLEEKNTELQNQLTESSQKIKVNTKLIKDLSQKVLNLERDLSVKSTFTEQLKKDLNLKLQKAKDRLRQKQCEQRKSVFDERLKKSLNEKLVSLTIRLKAKEVEQKQLDFRCEELNLSNTRINAKCESQKKELNRVRNELLTVTQALANSEDTNRTLNLQGEGLTKKLALVKKSNEELQKLLLAEKKMSRELIQERDNMLEKQAAKFQTLDKDLANHRLIIESLTNALTQKVGECRIQKEAAKHLNQKHQKRIAELHAKIAEVEKREQELKNKGCEYCGLS